MGSPLSPVIANVVMERLEQGSMIALEEKGVHFEVYRRYVDDCLCAAKNEHTPIILDTFNEFHEKLNFTLENEMEGKLKFLDMTLTRENGKIKKTWLPKQTNGRYLDFTSDSPHQHKRNTAIALIDRAIKLTDVENRPSTIEAAKTILVKNNYPNWFVKQMVKQRVHKHYNGLQNKEKPETRYISTPYIPCLSEKLSKILKKHNTTLAPKPKDKIKNRIFSMLKDPIPRGKQKNVVYAVPCGAGDDKVYIGQTSRKLEVRIAEHRNDTKKTDARTGLAQHTIQDGHIFDFANTRILERINDQASRTTAEMFHIKLRGDEWTVNLQRECGTFNNTYNSLLVKLRETTPTNDERRNQPNEREHREIT